MSVFAGDPLGPLPLLLPLRREEDEDEEEEGKNERYHPSHRRRGRLELKPITVVVACLS